MSTIYKTLNDPWLAVKKISRPQLIGALHKCHLITEILSMMTKYLMNRRVTVSKLINNKYSLICPLYTAKRRQIACFYWTKWNGMRLNGVWYTGIALKVSEARLVAFTGASSSPLCYQPLVIFNWLKTASFELPKCR